MNTLMMSSCFKHILWLFLCCKGAYYVFDKQKFINMIINVSSVKCIILIHFVYQILDKRLQFKYLTNAVLYRLTIEYFLYYKGAYHLIWQTKFINMNANISSVKYVILIFFVYQILNKRLFNIFDHFRIVDTIENKLN